MKLQRTMKGLVRADFMGRLPWGNHGEKVMKDKIIDCYGDGDDIIGVIKKTGDRFDWVWIYKKKTGTKK